MYTFPPLKSTTSPGCSCWALRRPSSDGDTTRSATSRTNGGSPKREGAVSVKPSSSATRTAIPRRRLTAKTCPLISSASRGTTTVMPSKPAPALSTISRSTTLIPATRASAKGRAPPHLGEQNDATRPVRSLGHRRRALGWNVQASHHLNRPGATTQRAFARALRQYVRVGIQTDSRSCDVPTIEEQYTDEMYEQRGYFATWEPHVPIKLGDCGPITGRTFKPQGDLVPLAESTSAWRTRVSRQTSTTRRRAASRRPSSCGAEHRPSRTSRRAPPAWTAVRARRGGGDGSEGREALAHQRCLAA